MIVLLIHSFQVESHSDNTVWSWCQASIHHWEKVPCICQSPWVLYNNMSATVYSHILLLITIEIFSSYTVVQNNRFFLIYIEKILKSAEIQYIWVLLYMIVPFAVQQVSNLCDYVTYLPNDWFSLFLLKFFCILLGNDVVIVSTPPFADSITEGDVRWEKGGFLLRSVFIISLLL